MQTKEYLKSDSHFYIGSMKKVRLVWLFWILLASKKRAASITLVLDKHTVENEIRTHAGGISLRIAQLQ